MIRTVADFLQKLADAEVARLDAVDIQHGPTIGDMYEGLSANLLQRAVPEQLGLQIVSGFISDGRGNLSGQVDCMLVRGNGAVLPYTNRFVWPIQDVIAVFEIKKTLYRDDLIDAFGKLRRVGELDRSFRLAPERKDVVVDVESAQRAFAETTRMTARSPQEIDSLPPSHRPIFHTLVQEQLAPVGIVLGYHGYASESALRDSLWEYLENQVHALGYGPGNFPQLMISGRFSLLKANGQPYSARMHEGWWPFYLSSRVNPVLLILEFVWTRLDLHFNIGGLWGADLELEALHPYLLAKPATTEDGRTGWYVWGTELDENEVAARDDVEPWQPVELSIEQFVVLQRLCHGDSVRLDDPGLLGYLEENGLDPEQLRTDLLDTGLVAMAGSEVVLITVKCTAFALPDGRLVAGENNTGRMERWVERHFPPSASSPLPPEDGSQDPG